LAVVPTVIAALGIVAAAISAGPVALARSTAGAAAPASTTAATPTELAAQPAGFGTLAAGVRLRPAETVERKVVLVKPEVRAPAPGTVVMDRADRGSTMVVLGDSYTSGWQGAGTGAHGWPRIVGRERGWHVLNFAVPGTGFLNPGWTAQPIRSLVSRTVARHPDVVVIAAGHNDSRWSPSSTEMAADRVIDRIHRSLPEAAIVVIGPIWQDGSPPSRCLALRDHLGRTAAAVGAVFVDPIGERWFAGSRHRMIRADGIHPDDAGHRWMAARVLAALARSGI
jgi:lysophospholipase L1-like esterase